MKRAYMIILLLMLIFSASSLSAQDDSDGDGIPDSRDKCPDVAGPASNDGCPVFTIVTPPPPVIDTDGDGIPDSDDQCPTVPGPRENRGCPVGDPATPLPPPPPPADQPTPPPSSQPDPNDPPPFEPPPLPNDACYVTPRTNNIVNVRDMVELDANILGFLAPGNVYEAQGVITVGTDTWYALVTYQGSTGTVGYSFGNVLLATSDCPPIAPPPVPPVGTSIDDFAPTTSNPGPLEMQCAAQPGTTLLQVCWCDTSDSECVAQLDLICNGGSAYMENGPDTTACWWDGDGNSSVADFNIADFQAGDDDDDATQTVEYCIYQEVHEVGVFEEVCYEIEIPDGCVLTTSEVGVYTVDCGDGDTVTLNPVFDNLPAIDLQAPTRDEEPVVISLRFVYHTGADCNNNGIDDLDELLPPNCVDQMTSNEDDDPQGVYFDYIIGALSICEPGQIWQVYPSRPDAPICINPIDDLTTLDTFEEPGVVLVGVVPNDGPAQAQVDIDVWEEFLALHCYPQNWWSSVDNDGNVSGGCWDQDADTASSGDGPQLGLAIVGSRPAPDQLVAVGGTGTVEDTTPEDLCPDEIAFFTWLEDEDGNVIPGSVDLECLPPDFFD